MRRLPDVRSWLLLILTGWVGAAVASEVLPARGTVEVAFSPADEPEKLLLRVIGSARDNLHVQAYAFTSKPVANALVAAHRRGVKVEVLADARMNARESGNVIPLLLAAGVPVAYETAYSAAHNKVIVADADGPGCVVATGSYNFTWSAEHRNAENLIVLRDNCPLAQRYRANWLRHRSAATPVHRLPFVSR
ncbi:MAG: phospholipase D family protein [Zoogloeaceae bacterium]|nr:phospholipase D family protein [Zoogloeaceae bacterium]